MAQMHQEHIKLRSTPAPQSHSREKPQDDFGDDDEIVSLNEQPSAEGSTGNRFTKNGVPDRRYKGQRDLPEAEVRNLDYTHPTVGSQDEEGIHRTKDGKPDRRFLENRAMSDEEAKVKQAEYFLAHRDEIGVTAH